MVCHSQICLPSPHLVALHLIFLRLLVYCHLLIYLHLIISLHPFCTQAGKKQHATAPNHPVTLLCTGRQEEACPPFLASPDLEQDPILFHAPLDARQPFLAARNESKRTESVSDNSVQKHRWVLGVGGTLSSFFPQKGIEPCLPWRNADSVVACTSGMWCPC